MQAYDGYRLFVRGEILTREALERSYAHPRIGVRREGNR